jgi:hypothetical protein
MGLTNFPNGVTSYGIPVVPGLDFGKVWGDTYFVDTATGSDGNDGKSPSMPFKTIQKGINASADAKGDRVFVRNGAYAETLTISTSHDNIMLIGESRGGVVVTGATDATDTLTIAAADCTIAHMSFAPYDTGSDISLIKITGNNNRVAYCDFSGAELQIEAVGAAKTFIIGCHFVTPADTTDGACIHMEDSNDCKILYCGFFIDSNTDAIIHHDADNLEVGWCNGVGDDDTGASVGAFVNIVGADATSELMIHDCNVTLFASLITEVGAAVAAHGLGTSDLATTATVDSIEVPVVYLGNNCIGCTLVFDTAE